MHSQNRVSCIHKLGGCYDKASSKIKNCPNKINPLPKVRRYMRNLHEFASECGAFITLQ